MVIVNELTYITMFPFFSVSNDGSSTQIFWNRLVFSKSNLNLFVPSSILLKIMKTYLCPQYNHLLYSVERTVNWIVHKTEVVNRGFSSLRCLTAWLSFILMDLKCELCLWSRVWSYCTLYSEDSNVGVGSFLVGSWQLSWCRIILTYVTCVSAGRRKGRLGAKWEHLGFNVLVPATGLNGDGR